MKSKRLLESENLKKSSKKLYQNYKNKIIDMLLFGSFAKGKFDPSDIDVAVLLKNTRETEILKLGDEFKKFFSEKIHLNLVLIETLLYNPLFKTLIHEGISLLDNKQLIQRIGYESGAIFSLNLTRLNKSKKVLFSYALHGHKNNKGELARVKGKNIGKAVVFVSSKFKDEFKEFLELWNTDFYIMEVLKK